MDEEDPLANMAFSDASSDEAEDKDSKQARRTGQTEEAWKAIQKDYRTKIEDGNIHENIKLPLGPGTSKMDIQELIHAVEELYFFRRYEQAEKLATQAISGSHGIDKDAKQLLTTYQQRCQNKLKSQAKTDQA